VGGVIVKDDLDRSMRRIGRVNNLEKFDELAASMPVPDQGVNLPGQQIDAGQKADGAMALVFMITPEGRMHGSTLRQVGKFPPPVSGRPFSNSLFDTRRPVSRTGRDRFVRVSAVRAPGPGDPARMPEGRRPCGFEVAG
jgi:hypothetical protein